MGWTVHLVAYRLEFLVTCVEIVLSGCYVWFFAKRFMRDDALPGPEGARMKRELRWTFVLLVLTELFVIAGDIAVVTVWMTGLFLMRLAIDPLIYSLKLKVEFLLLNRLTAMTQQKAELRHISVSTALEMTDGMSESPTDAEGVVEKGSTRGGHPARTNGMALNTVDGAEGGGPGRWQSTKDKQLQVAQRDIASLRPVATDSSDVLQPRESFDSVERRYLGRSGFGGPSRMV
jgi:hypothetical protein